MKYLLSTAAAIVVVAAASGAVVADDFRGFGPDFGRHDNGFGHDNDFGHDHGFGDHDHDHDNNGNGNHGNGGHGVDPHQARTATPIKHLVVIFGENRSFDHYFGVYPNAKNPDGEPKFVAVKHTPEANNYTANPYLLNNNPNLNPANNIPANGSTLASVASNPFRIDRTQADTAGQNHAYTAEQKAYDNGKADLFPEFTGNGTSGGAGTFGTKGQVMGYFDGNTVTAMWNYAQNFAMSDNAYTDSYGPSSPGAINVISGQTNGVVAIKGTFPNGNAIADGQGGITMTGDFDPGFDMCSSTTTSGILLGKNIGDLLNDANLSWGSFMGGFNLKTTNPNGSTGCTRSMVSPVTGRTNTDYVPHHAWFQYYPSTANPNHLRPSSVSAIGHTFDAHGVADPANHGYDLDDFYATVSAGNFPAVSYIKMQAYQDGHPGNSNSLDEQAGVVKLINFLQQQPDWSETAVIITYDDSDGWYDHAYARPTTASYDATADQVNGPGQCGLGVSQQTQPKGLNGLPVNGRCGPGTRVPFLVISPFAKQNYIGHDRISQASVVRFIEDNWLNGRRIGSGSVDASAGSIEDLFDFHNANNDKLILDQTQGTVVTSNNGHGH